MPVRPIQLDEVSVEVGAIPTKALELLPVPFGSDKVSLATVGCIAGAFHQVIPDNAAVLDRVVQITIGHLSPMPQRNHECVDPEQDHKADDKMRNRHFWLQIKQVTSQSIFTFFVTVTI